MALAMGTSTRSLSSLTFEPTRLSKTSQKNVVVSAASRKDVNIFTSGLSRHNTADLGGRNGWKKISLKVQKRSSSQNSGIKAMTGGSGNGLPLLNDLPLISYISNQGLVLPPVEPGTQATVFAVFDKNKKVQYVGFSKDVRNSLRTLMGRRPEFCYYYKLVCLTSLDQKKMIDIRQQWFSELGLPPVGNTDPIQKDYWEKPADAGSISERGRKAAASSKAKTLVQMMKDRGLKEEMEYDPALLEQGKCDVLPSKGLSEEEVATMAREGAESAAKSNKVLATSPSGESIEFDIEYVRKIKTNGGWMFDININKDDKETRHRVIIGRIYTDAAGIPEEEFLDRVMAFLLYKKLPRHTEGVLSNYQFPINYFSVSEVAQTFPEMKDWFNQDLPESYWRFNKIHSYGGDESPVYQERPQITAPQY